MSTSIDMRALRSAVEKALGGGAQGLAAGWSAGDGKGRVYKGATFEFEDCEIDGWLQMAFATVHGDLVLQRNKMDIIALIKQNTQ